MADSLAYKILRSHLVSGELSAGDEIAIRVDQTLTQDATGTMTYLQFEAIGVPRVKTELSVSYVDHNMLQTGFENADDHRFLATMAAKYGLYFSRPGNGICHQVHLERFSTPGAILLGSDSHTPTSGGVGSLAIGAGGLDVAVAMAGGSFYLNTPKIIGVKLTGSLQPWVTGKDVILEVLRRLSVKGGVGCIMEYYGPGVDSLSLPERSTVTNMGAELGATTSIFPSDQVTREYLRAQGREEAWTEVGPDDDPTYDEELEINLDELEPLVACPSSPDLVKTARELADTPLEQVCVGSCTNSSFRDLKVCAEALKGQVVAPGLSMTVTPGSKQVFEMIAREGALADFIAAGVRILESACGPCIGMGQTPASGSNSLRSFNRNFAGRSGDPNDHVYLASPETCVASALTGVITDPRTLGDYPVIHEPRFFLINDDFILPPREDGEDVEIIRGPNIKPLPINEELPAGLQGKVQIKVGDNITTDHIMPAGAKILPLRSNIPAISEFVYTNVDPEFASRCKADGGGFIVGGDNYGQGSSREHAALAPMFLGIKAVLAKSLARIHRANLINFGIVPLLFTGSDDYDQIEQGDELTMEGIGDQLLAGEKVVVKNVTKGIEIELRHDMSPREVQIMLVGGLLNQVRAQHVGNGEGSG